MLILLVQGARSQEVPGSPTPERIEACTDRTLYISGEEIRFSFLLVSTDPDRTAGSRIVYCEVISPAGDKITGGKFMLRNSAEEGCLTIPEETVTGIYYLRLYTRWMRNFSPDDYTYIMLKIINPSNSEVRGGTGLPGGMAPIPYLHGPDEGKISLEIQPEKSSFSPREEVGLTVTVTPESQNRSPDSGPLRPASLLSLAVIPEFSLADSAPVLEGSHDASGSALYVPETKGISLSGKVVDSESGTAIPRVMVYLSIIGDRDVQVVMTDSTGRFFFTLPSYAGSRDIFLCTGNKDDFTPKILIDNDFCTKPVTLPSPPFTLSEEELTTAYQMAVNVRLSELFQSDTASMDEPADTTEELHPTPFYGEPTEVLVMDKYIDLPALEEYFTELSMIVKLRTVQRKKEFRFYTTLQEMSLYPPLMLVDWVAVNDIEKILAMSPLDIDRIEFVNAPYLKGNITYGGIISFVSKKGDFAGIDLPESGTFVNYEFLDDAACTQPDPPSSSTIPDSRNTLCWIPSIQLNDQGQATLFFTTPDTPGRYMILLRQLNSTGEMQVVERVIEVRRKR